jgi:hypothetical protein
MQRTALFSWKIFLFSSMISLHRQPLLPLGSAAYLFLLAALWLAIAGCAGMRAPEGGPVDTTPPEIISVYPAPNTVNYTDNKIVLEFGKYVERRSVEESIFISPNISDLEFDWSGTEVEITFREPLKTNTTYVVTVGTDVVDMNNRNRMAQAFSLAFSTGSQIDYASIRGTVSDSKPAGVMVFAYRLDGINADTLNPMTQKPDFITQTGTIGDYALSHLAFGLYRVMAVRDEFRNLLYDPETDAYAMATGDVTLTAQDTMRSHVDFLLSTEDTTAPRLLTAAAKDAEHVLLTFSKSLDSASVSRSAFIIADTNGHASVPVLTHFADAQTRTTVTLVTRRQEKDSLYRVFVANIRDQHHHMINPLASSKIFTGSGLPDTLPPQCIELSLRDSGSFVGLQESVIFGFNDALDTLSASRSIRLTDIDSNAVAFSIRWDDPARLRVVPSAPFRPATRYLLRLAVDSLRDLAGNRHRDSVRVFKFQSIDPELFGSLQGSLSDDRTDVPDQYVVVARYITGNNKEMSTRVKRDKPFTLRPLAEGQYTLRAFYDAKKNGNYFSGKAFPYEPASRFTSFSDTVKIRARWPIEGLKLKLMQ